MNPEGGAPQVTTVVVTEEQAGLRLDQALTSLIPQRSRSFLQRLIREGRVSVGATPVTRTSHEVAPGEVVTVEMPPLQPGTPQPQALPIEVVFEDQDLVVVN